MIPTILLLATLCLPPGLPPLDTLEAFPSGIYLIEGPGDIEYRIVGTIYQDHAGHVWKVLSLLGAIALVDDHMADEKATDWWIDPGLVTDDAPPKAQADPTSSCQWRRRADHT